MGMVQVIQWLFTRSTKRAVHSNGNNVKTNQIIKPQEIVNKPQPSLEELLSLVKGDIESCDSDYSKSLLPNLKQLLEEASTKKQRVILELEPQWLRSPSRMVVVIAGEVKKVKLENFKPLEITIELFNESNRVRAREHINKVTKGMPRQHEPPYSIYQSCDQNYDPIIEICPGNKNLYNIRGVYFTADDDESSNSNEP